MPITNCEIWLTGPVPHPSALHPFICHIWNILFLSGTMSAFYTLALCTSTPPFTFIFDLVIYFIPLAESLHRCILFTLWITLIIQSKFVYLFFIILSSRLLSRNVKIKTCKTIILRVVLYGCKTWSLTLRKEHRLRVFENRVLRRMFGPKRDEVTGVWRKLHNEELHGLYS
jgi:hypothetical protein